MILSYIDESGDTGKNLEDHQQPVFVLGALLVHQEQWNTVEAGFLSLVNEHFEDRNIERFELHAMDLVNARKAFKGFTIQQIVVFRDRCLALIKEHELKIIYRSIEKKRFKRFCEQRFGSGLVVLPYTMALPFVCGRINEILEERDDFGLLIFDQRHDLTDIEKTVRFLRLDEVSPIRTQRLIERGFFVDSTKSAPIQLLDLALYYIRKLEEHKLGRTVSAVHQQTFPLIEEISESLMTFERTSEVVGWAQVWTQQEKKRSPPKDGTVP